VHEALSPVDGEGASAFSTYELVSGSATLARPFSEGDMPTSFPDAYRRFFAPVRAKCRRMAIEGALAEDIVQETFERLLTKGPSLSSEPETIMSWLYQTSTRLALDALRTKKRRPDAEPDVMSALPCGHSARLEAALDARNAIIALCKEMPPEELEAAVLARVDGLTLPRTAEVLGISERTVRRMLDRFDERTSAMRKDATS
jgi:RNA polymerase sigma-70 factor, ECF subfamily